MAFHYNDYSAFYSFIAIICRKLHLDDVVYKPWTAAGVASTLAEKYPTVKRR